MGVSQEWKQKGKWEGFSLHIPKDFIASESISLLVDIMDLESELQGKLLLLLGDGISSATQWASSNFI